MVSTIHIYFKYSTFISLTICSLFILSCSNMKTVIAFKEGNNLIVEKSEFINKESKSEYEFIIVTSNYIKAPIVLFRRGTSIYEAYSLICTHDNEKLIMEDNRFVCPVDGSSFDNQGRVIIGPAYRDLKQYSVDKTSTTIEIEI